MVFNSLDFVAFFAVVYGLYVVLPHRGQNFLLLLASYAFYACWDWRFLSLLFLSTAVDYILALKISESESPVLRKRYLIASMCVSLGVLGFFKYFNFFADSLASLLQSMGWDIQASHLNIILPWGISFYTFQTMNYTIDVYRRHMEPCRNLFNFAVFVSFFPHLVAGPIMRANVLLPQVNNKRTVTWQQVSDGTWLCLWGLFKKVVVADNLATIADAGFADGVEHTLGSMLIAVYAFAFQIYCDFSGYSDIARGISKFMGFELMVNFRNPYFAVNPSDFWRRWHISLSTWLRDYLYIPLGGSRKGPGRTYVNLTITMLLGGLWHGANWTFVVWGAFHGLFLAAHRFVAGDERKQASHGRWSRILCMVGMFHAVCVGWVFFRATTFTQAWSMLSAVVHPELGAVFWSGLALMGLLCWPIWLVEWMQEKTDDDMVVHRLSLVPRATLYTILVVMLLVLGNTGSRTFIYFQF